MHENTFLSYAILKEVPIARQISAHGASSVDEGLMQANEHFLTLRKALIRLSLIMMSASFSRARPRYVFCIFFKQKLKALRY